LSKLCGIPLVKTFHVVFSATPNYWNNNSKQSNVSRLTSIIGPFFEKLTIRLPADVVHTAGNSTQKKLTENKAKIVIQNIVNRNTTVKLTDKLTEKVCYYWSKRGLTKNWAL
jgi:hypothetical protein